MTGAGFAWDRRSKAGVAAAVAILLVSLYVRSGFPIVAAADAHYDDALFVRLAGHLAAGEWLGPYGHTTLAKGAAYPAFIALAWALHLPLKLAEHLAYLAASAAFAWSAALVLRSRLAGLACLLVLALNPVLWSAESGGRVVREGLYVTLGLALLALAMRAFVLDRGRGPAQDLRGIRATLVALGAVGAAFWLTREEGLWLAPSLAILALAWIARQWRPRDGIAAGPHRRAMAAFLALPLVAFGAVVAAVNLANYAKYGVFINNEFRARDFPRAYGALSRVAHDAPRPYVLFPADARRRAYAASPAARELAPAFEGPLGEDWRAVGCRQTGTDPCPEILSGWLMWALRDAAAAAGHHASASGARAYYRRLAREVNAACDRGEIPCGPRVDSMVPPWRPEYLPRALDESWRVAVALATLGDLHVHMLPSTGSERERARFTELTRERQANADDWQKIRPGRMAFAERLARLQVAVTPVLLAAALAGSVAIAGVAAWRRRFHPGLAVLAALLAAIAMRVGLLGFLAATSIPPNDVLYLTPVTPMALVLAPFVLFLALDMRRRKTPE